MKILDYYYLTLIRVIMGTLAYKAAPLMALTIFFNMLTVVIIFAQRFLVDLIWWCWFWRIVGCCSSGNVFD